MPMYRILVVEDDPAIIEAIRQALHPCDQFLIGFILSLNRDHIHHFFDN